ncbi:Inositol monophosphatase 1, partial [Chelonia mydas]
VVREALKEEISIMVKSSPADLVTVTDQKVEKMIISSIKEKYPSHSFIGEESVAAGEGSTLTDNPTWIIDPIDGTTNFVHRFPFVAVSIGFVVNKKIEFGVVYSCVEDKMYTGRKGKGAFCNGQKLQVSGQEDITKSLLVTEMGSNREPETLKIVLSNMERLLSIPVHGIRAVGTAAVNMCLVATGGADAYYEMGIHCWDMAGAGIIITEAGGVLLDVSVCEVCSAIRHLQKLQPSSNLNPALPCSADGIASGTGRKFYSQMVFHLQMLICQKQNLSQKCADFDDSSDRSQTGFETCLPGFLPAFPSGSSATHPKDCPRARDSGVYSSVAARHANCSGVGDPRAYRAPCCGPVDSHSL